MRVRIRGAIAAVAALPLVLTACGGDSSSGGGGTDGATLTIHHAAGFPEALVLIENADEFEEKTGITLEFVESGWDDLDANQNMAMSSGSGEYDLLYVGARGYQLVQPNSLPLDEFIEEEYGSVDKWKKRFNQPHIELNIGDDGSVRSWPFHTTAQFGIYRAELFEDPEEKAAFKNEYGYPLAPPKNYDQLLDVAEFFTRDTDGDGSIDMWGMLTPGDKWDGGALFYDQLYRHDIHPFDTDFNVELKDDEKRDRGIDVAAFWQDLVYEHEVMSPDTASINNAQMLELWRDGSAAMSYGWWGDHFNGLADPDIVDRIGETKSFNLFPYDDQTGGVIAWSSWAVSQDTDNPDAAFEFIKWATNETNQKQVTEEYGYLSGVTTWSEESAAQGHAPPALPKAIDTGRLWPLVSIPESALVNEVVQDQGTALFSDVTDPEGAIQSIADGVEEILNEAGHLD